MEYKCLICHKQLKSKRSLSLHLRHFHHLSFDEYDKKFNLGLVKYCKKCGIKLSKKCKGDFCNIHRDRSGKNNSFYGKKHKKSSIEKIKHKTSLKSKELWKDEEYRKKVIKAISKPRYDGFREAQSIRIKEWYKNNPNEKVKRSDYMKEYWSKGIIKPSITKYNESKAEIEIRNYLIEKNSHLKISKDTIYINKKWYYPDILINNYLIIEYYGDYWHANPKFYNKTQRLKHGRVKDIWKNNKKRIEKLIKAGYKVLIIWQDDYTNCKEDVLLNINNWIKKYEQIKNN